MPLVCVGAAAPNAARSVDLSLLHVFVGTFAADGLALGR